MPDGGGASPTADEVLAEVGRVRRRTRMTLADGAWRYLLVWALVFFGAWASSFSEFAQWYWLIGLPAGWIGMFLMYRGIEPAAGKRDALYWIGGLGIGCVEHGRWIRVAR